MSTKSTNRRRFSDDQIRSLETTFETESRPELRLKQHLATELGLQPRQVAIWFQNKRARSKSKQIEGQYSVLKSNYDQLASQFEALRKENQTLIIQLQRLRKMADKRGGGENDSMTFNGSDDIYMPPTWTSELNRKDSYLEEEEADVLNMVQMAEASPENGCSFESDTFLDTHSGPQLWDF